MEKVKRWFIVGLITAPLLFSVSEGAVIKGVLSNFDLHNFNQGMVNDLEVILKGIGCNDILDYYQGIGYPPACSLRGDGVIIRWKFEDDPIQPCNWGHFGVQLKEGAKQPEWGWAMWSIRGDLFGDPIPFPWQWWEEDPECRVIDVIVPTPDFQTPIVVFPRWAISDEVIPLKNLTRNDRMVMEQEWHPVESAVLEEGDSLITVIGPVKEGDKAVLVMYDVYYPATEDTEALFINEAIVEPCAPPEEEFDFGDAPDRPYPSLLANNGARHRNQEGIFEWLGDIKIFSDEQKCDTFSPQVDMELDSWQVDDDSPNSPPGKDDGIKFYPPYNRADRESLDVLISTTCAPQRYGTLFLYLNAWFDWTRDGDWDDPNEHIFWLEAKPIAPMSGPPFPVNADSFRVDPSKWDDCCQLYRLYFKSYVTDKPAPDWEWGDRTWTRFRLSYRENSNTVKGPTVFGEVEDYIVDVKVKGIGEKPRSIPSTLTLTQNSPNPFGISTTIQYGIPEDGWVSLSIYNVAGEKVKVLMNGRIKAGTYEIEWNGCDEEGKKLPSGIYFYRFTTKSYSITRTMILLR